MDLFQNPFFFLLLSHPKTIRSPYFELKWFQSVDFDLLREILQFGVSPFRSTIKIIFRTPKALMKGSGFGNRTVSVGEHLEVRYFHSGIWM